MQIYKPKRVKAFLGFFYWCKCLGFINFIISCMSRNFLYVLCHSASNLAAVNSRSRGALSGENTVVQFSEIIGKKITRQF